MFPSADANGTVSCLDDLNTVDLMSVLCVGLVNPWNHHCHSYGIGMQMHVNVDGNANVQSLVKRQRRWLKVVGGACGGLSKESVGRVESRSQGAREGSNERRTFSPGFLNLSISSLLHALSAHVG